jgi:hypothetical protein
MSDRRNSESKGMLSFGPFSLFAAERLLKKADDPIPLGGRAGIVTLAREERARTIRGTDFHAAATTSRHVVIAAARSTRCD